ncbi:MAG: T9SS type A sorting domain-containing protein [Bacteroidia bacterium]
MNKHLLSLYLLCSLFCLLLASNKTHACSGRDVIFTSITFTSVSPGDYQYSYQIQNIGTTDIAFNQLVIQNYVSTDNQVGGDAAAGGSFIDNTSSGILAAGATYNGTAGASPFPANPQSSYPYLIAQIYLSSDPECDAANNYFPALVQTTTGIKPSLLLSAVVNWNAENKSFTVSDWPGNAELEYNVYTSAGMLMLSGNTRNNEPTPLGALRSGFYILYLSDGEKMYSRKIIY